MKFIMQKMLVPALVIGVVNLVGYLYYTNYIGAVVGSVIGGIIGLVVSEIRTKFN
jgi:ascorbate-specific PTS system EIIC-type component UlaA